MLNRKVITQSLSSFSAITFTLCVGYGLLVPSAFHAAWWNVTAKSARERGAACRFPDWQGKLWG